MRSRAMAVESSTSAIARVRDAGTRGCRHKVEIVCNGYHGQAIGPACHGIINGGPIRQGGERVGEIGLRVKVNEHDLIAFLGQYAAQTGNSSGLADTTFMVGHGDNSCFHLLLLIVR